MPNLLQIFRGGRTGASTTIKPGQTNAEVLKVQSTDEADPAAITLTFGREIPREFAANPTEQHITGSLSFGPNAVPSELVFDWGRGGQITIPTTTIHLRASYSGGGGEVVLWGGIGIGTRSSGPPSSLTLTRYHPATGPNYTERVPAYANAVTLFTEDYVFLAGGRLILELLGIDGSLRYRYVPTGSDTKDAVNLPGNVYAVRVVNASGNVFQTALQFGLSL